MSHFTTIQTRIRDLDALEDACAELGLELVRQGEARGYGGSVRRAAAVVRLKGPYDIAADPADDGSYGLTTDWWNGHVEREAGKNFGTLLQLYGVHKATREARRRGHCVRRQPLGDGSIKLTIGGFRS